MNIIALSGGVDSCYAALYSPKPIAAVTFMNGWDTEESKHNCDVICKHLDIYHSIYTPEDFGISQKNFYEIQRSFLLAGTPHAEVPSDVFIKLTLLKAAKLHGANFIFTGANKTEGRVPLDFSPIDGLYLRDVVKKHARWKIKVPRYTLFHTRKLKRLSMNVLDYLEYDREVAKEELKALGWRDYGTKHYENVYTIFSQGLRYYKFGIDMRAYELAARVKYDIIDEVDMMHQLNVKPMPMYQFMILCDEVQERLGIRWDDYFHTYNDWTKYKSYRKWLNLI